MNSEMIFPETKAIILLLCLFIVLDTDRARCGAPPFDIRATAPFYPIKNRRSLYARTLRHFLITAANCHHVFDS